MSPSYKINFSDKRRELIKRTIESDLENIPDESFMDTPYKQIKIKENKNYSSSKKIFNRYKVNTKFNEEDLEEEKKHKNIIEQIIKNRNLDNKNYLNRNRNLINYLNNIDNKNDYILPSSSEMIKISHLDNDINPKFENKQNYKNNKDYNYVNNSNGIINRNKTFEEKYKITDYDDNNPIKDFIDHINSKERNKYIYNFYDQNINVIKNNNNDNLENNNKNFNQNNNSKIINSSITKVNILLRPSTIKLPNINKNESIHISNKSKNDISYNKKSISKNNNNINNESSIDLSKGYINRKKSPYYFNDPKLFKLIEERNNNINISNRLKNFINLNESVNKKSNNSRINQTNRNNISLDDVEDFEIL